MPHANFHDEQKKEQLPTGRCGIKTVPTTPTASAVGPRLRQPTDPAAGAGAGAKTGRAQAPEIVAEKVAPRKRRIRLAPKPQIAKAGSKRPFPKKIERPRESASWPEHAHARGKLGQQNTGTLENYCGTPHLTYA